MKRLALMIAILLIPAQFVSAGHYVWRNGYRYWYSCGNYYSAPSYGYSYCAPSHCAPAAPSKTAGQIAAGLLEKKAEWDFILKAANTIVGPQNQGYGAPYVPQYGNQVQSGNTAYSANTGSYTESYTTVNATPLDVNAMYAQAVQLQEQVNKAQQEGNKGLQAHLGQALAGLNAALATQLQGQREAANLKAMQPINPQEIQATTTYHASAEVSGSQNTTPTNPTPNPNPAPADPQLMAQPVEAEEGVNWAFLQSTVNNKCVTCHDAGSPDGGFNMAGDVRQYNRPMWEKIIDRVTRKAGHGRMPKDAPPLSAAEKGEITSAWGTTNQ